ncbi:MAG: hypothetical protein PHH20_03405 [Candidatus Omnitrophica bacterium]|nr:hypothetical protein [Candidatus Omnitrophota bacterium]
MKKLFLAVIILSICSVCNANTVINPGFESDEESWYNWNDQETNGIITTEYKYSGEKAACRQIEGIGQGCYGQQIPVNPGETVKASAWVMSPDSKALSNGAEAFIRLEFWGSAGPLSSGHKESEHVKAAIPWKKLEVNGKAPAGAIEARVLGYARGIAGSTGEACFDDFDVTIEKGN